MEDVGSGGSGKGMPRSVVSTSSQRSRWAQTPIAIEMIIQHDCSEMEVASVSVKHSVSYSSGPPEVTRRRTRVPRRDMQARTKFRKRFMSSEGTKSPIRVRRENIHLAWVSVNFCCSGSASIQWMKYLSRWKAIFYTQKGSIPVHQLPG